MIAADHTQRHCFKACHPNEFFCPCRNTTYPISINKMLESDLSSLKGKKLDDKFVGEEIPLYICTSNKQRTMEGTIILETFKTTWFYKLIKTSEAVFVGGGLILGIIFGWFNLIPALAIIGGYITLNALGLANSEPYIIRDIIKEKIDEKYNDVDARFNEENGVTYK